MGVLFSPELGRKSLNGETPLKLCFNIYLFENLILIMCFRCTEPINEYPCSCDADGTSIQCKIKINVSLIILLKLYDKNFNLKEKSNCLL